MNGDLDQIYNNRRALGSVKSKFVSTQKISPDRRKFIAIENCIEPEDKVRRDCKSQLSAAVKAHS